MTYLYGIRDWLDLGISDWSGVLEDMSDLGKLIRQSGTPRFGFGTRSRFRRLGEHLPPCLPFGIGVARSGLVEGAEIVALLSRDDFAGLGYVERIKSSKP